MSNHAKILVGDRFGSFGTLDGAITVSALAHLFDVGTSDEAIPTQIVFGQGVSESWWTYLKNRATERGINGIFSGVELVQQRAGRRFCHKWQRRNVLITDPESLDERHYRMLLSIDDECEIMSDHVTGCHIQGMVLIEAARQAFLAVSEWFLLPRTANYYFVINRFDSSFNKFAFPIATDIYLRLTSVDASRDDRLSAKAHINFVQKDESVCDVYVEYSAILEDKLSGKEVHLAEAALCKALAAANVVQSSFAATMHAVTVDAI